ncbi:MAG: TonB family protein [Paludibacteraceae bacterium]|nr:TonB family protein [Paludibacteraceae bacterium]
MSKKNDNSSKVAGVIGTILVHLLLLLAIYFYGLRTVIPVEEEGLTVDYGSADTGEGLFEPAPLSEIEQDLDQQAADAVSVPDINAPSEQKVVAQEIEESLEVKQQREEARKKEQERLAEIKRQKEEEQKRKEEEARKQKELAERAQKAASTTKNAFSGAGGKGTDANAKSQGTTGGTGNQGSVTGFPGGGNSDGAGIGANYSLAGRKIVGAVPKPAYNKNETGIIVVTIEVDASGKVLSARAGATGTTIGDATLRREAELAAKKAKFNANDGSQIQTGTITYKYVLN